MTSPLSRTVTAANVLLSPDLIKCELLHWRKFGFHRVLRKRPFKEGRKQCFTKDEGRPLGVGLQEQAPNRHKLRSLRVSVVSVVGKGRARSCQVRVKETNASEPLMTCRKEFKATSKPERVIAPG